MEISDIRVKLIQDSSDRLKAVCSITLDDEFVVRDLKVVEGTNGLFVAMPSRKLSVHCPQCRGKNHLRARFCNECGGKLPPPRLTGDAAGRTRMHRDIAHPINPTFREIVQNRVIEKYRAESELAKSPDYTPTDIDAAYDESPEDSAPGYVPSEYDQLIAGLNKGSQESQVERDVRPAPRPARSGDRRRTDFEDRSARPPRNGPQRSPHQGRGDSRRPEGPRPGRGQGGNARPASMPEPVRVEDNVLDEVDGNFAPPVQAPSPAPVVRRPEPPPQRRTEALPVQRSTPPAPVPQPPVGDSDELPFGAGL